MTYPAIVVPSNVTKWPTQRNSMLGPFAEGGYLFGFSPSYSAFRLEAYASGDEGHVWTERDAASAPAIPSTPLNHLSVDNSGSTFYICVPGSATECDIHVFDASTLTWGTTLTGPSITWGNVGTGRTVVWYYYRSGVHVIAAQVADENVGGTLFRRCALYYGTPGAWTGPLYLSTGTSALPGVAANHELLYGIYGASSRFHLFWGEGTAQDKPVMTRVFTSSNTFGTTVNLNTQVTLTLNTSNHTFGLGCRYTDATTKLAVFCSPGAVGFGGATVLRVDSDTSDTASNWTREDITTTGGSFSTTNPGVVMNDGQGKKLWVWRVAGHLTKTLQFTNDGGTGAWEDFTDWKPDNPLKLFGVSSRFLDDLVGLYYCDELTNKLEFDVLHIYQSKISQGAGTVVTERDLGVGGVSDYLIFKDDAAPSGISNTIEVRMREDEGVLWGEPLITLGTDSSDSRDVANTGQTARFIQITETITGGSMESGVAGT